MLFYQTLFVLLHLAAAAPSNSHHKSSKASAKNLKCPTFDLPWTVSDLTIYKPAKQPTASAHSAISFRFKDTNPLLNLETNCAGTIVNDACEAESGGYVLCGDVRVGFKVDQNVILITRAFLDDCLGTAPWNYGRGFGQNSTTLVSTSDTSGTLWRQEEMLVYITEMT